MFDAVADLVGEVRIDDRLRRLVDVLDQIAQPQPHQFEQRNGDAFPPLVGLNLLDQLRLMRDRRNAGLVLQRRGDLDELLAQRVEALRALQQCELAAKTSGGRSALPPRFRARCEGKRRDLVDQFLALLSSIGLQAFGSRYFSTARRCWRTMKLSRFRPMTVSCKVFSASARMTASLGRRFVAGCRMASSPSVDLEPSRLLLIQRAHQIEPRGEQPFRQ